MSPVSLCTVLFIPTSQMVQTHAIHVCCFSHSTKLILVLLFSTTAPFLYLLLLSMLTLQLSPSVSWQLLHNPSSLPTCFATRPSTGVMLQPAPLLVLSTGVTLPLCGCIARTSRHRATSLLSLSLSCAQLQCPNIGPKLFKMMVYTEVYVCVYIYILSFKINAVYMFGEKKRY